MPALKKVVTDEDLAQANFFHGVFCNRPVLLSHLYGLMV